MKDLKITVTMLANSTMKFKFLLSMMLLGVVATTFAQEKKSVVATIVSIVKARQNEFIDVRGKVDVASSDSIEENFASKEGFDAATEFLTYSKRQTGSVFTSFFDYKVGDELIKASAVLEEVLKTVNILTYNSDKAKYKACDYKTSDGKDVTDMVDNDNGSLVMRLVIGGKINAMGLYFYSSTYGKP